MRHESLNIEIEKPEENLIYKRGYSTLVFFILLTCDILLINVSFITTHLLSKSDNVLNADFLSVLLVANLAWVVLVSTLNIYAVARVSTWESIIWNMFKSTIVHFLVMWLYMSILENYSSFDYFFLKVYSLFILLIFAWRIAFIHFTKQYMASHYNYKKVIIVGANEETASIYKYLLSNKTHRYSVDAIFGENIEEIDKVDTTTKFISEDNVYNYLSKEKSDEIYCALPLNEHKKIRELMSFAENNLIRFRYVPDFKALLYRKVDIEFYGNIPILSTRTEPLENIGNRFQKRIFDLAFSSLALAFLIPFVFPIISLMIRLSSKGPVFFKQKRNGRNNVLFDCYKFRTMKINENSDKTQATLGDPRVTKIGSFLRKTNLDELPQFVNVWIGNMSVVGPRPHMLKHTEDYKMIIDKFMVRHFVKPGITGWAQVNGLRGVTETSQKMIKRVRYDIWYMENWTMQLDIKIIFLTVFNMIKGEKNAF